MNHDYWLFSLPMWPVFHDVKGTEKHDEGLALAWTNLAELGSFWVVFIFVIDSLGGDKALVLLLAEVFVLRGERVSDSDHLVIDILQPIVV